jgi:hypothetical protein
MEVGSAWGLFEWLLRDAIKRGWKMGVCANSDEHRGRCGGGVPGTAVFGTKGGLTGVLSNTVDRVELARALRARRTFATTGERLVGLSSTDTGALQGDDSIIEAHKDLKLSYAFYGSEGFSSIEAWDASGCILKHDLRAEVQKNSTVAAGLKLSVTWGGARLYDRYREAVWDGTVRISGSNIKSTEAFGGILDVPGELVEQTSESQVAFKTHTSGDFDGVLLTFDENGTHPAIIVVSDSLGGYVKVGDPLKGNPHKAQPSFLLEATWDEVISPGGKTIEIPGGADLFVKVEAVPDLPLPRRVEGDFIQSGRGSNEKQAVYFVGREWNGGKVITSPIFVEWV